MARKKKTTTKKVEKEIEETKVEIGSDSAKGTENVFIGNSALENEEMITSTDIDDGGEVIDAEFEETERIVPDTDEELGNNEESQDFAADMISEEVEEKKVEKEYEEDVEEVKSTIDLNTLTKDQLRFYQRTGRIPE